MAAPTRLAPSAREILPFLLATASAAALAGTGVVPLVLGLPAAVGGFAAALLLRWLRPGLGLAGALPALPSLAFAVAVARVSIVTELLAATSALALLAASARDPGETPAPPARGSSTVLPVVAVLAALAASLLLPPSAAQVGLAAAVLVGAFLLVALLLGSARPLGTYDP